MKYSVLICCVTLSLLKINGNNGHPIAQPHDGYVYHHQGDGQYTNQNGVSPLFVKSFIKIMKFLSAHPKLVRTTHPAIIIKLLTHLSSKPALLAAVPQNDLTNFMNLVINTPNVVDNVPQPVFISLINSMSSPNLFSDISNRPTEDFVPYYSDSFPKYPSMMHNYKIKDHPTILYALPHYNIPTKPAVTEFGTLYALPTQTPLVPCPPQTPVVPGISVNKNVGLSVVSSSGAGAGVAAAAEVAAGATVPVAGIPQTPVVPGVSAVENVGVSLISPSGAGAGVAAAAEVAAGATVPVAGIPQTPVAPGVSAVENVGVSVISPSGAGAGVAAAAEVAAGATVPVAGIPQTPVAPGVSAVENVGVSVISPSGAGAGVAAAAEVAAGAAVGIPQTPVAPGVSAVENVGLSVVQPSGVAANAEVAACISSPATAVPCPPKPIVKPQVPGIVPISGGAYDLTYIPNGGVSHDSFPPMVHGTKWTHGTGVHSDLKMNFAKLFMDSIARGLPKPDKINPIGGWTAVKTKAKPILNKFQDSGLQKLHQHKLALQEKIHSFLENHKTLLSGKHTS